MRFINGSSSLSRSLTEPITTLLIGAILIVPAATAYADEDATLNPDPQKIKRQILASLDDPDFESELTRDSADDPWFTGFRLSKKGPVQFRQTLQIGDDEVLIKLYGPVVRKKPGLRFKVEGLRIGDHPVNVEGFGSVKEAGFRFTVRY